MKNHQNKIRLAGVVLGVCVVSVCWAGTHDTKWKSVSKSDFEEVSVEYGKVKVNNFTLSESKDFMTSKYQLNFSCSGRNKGKDTAYVHIQIIGLDQSDEKVFAMSARPVFLGMLSAGKNETVKQTTRVPKGSLAKVTKIEYRIIIDTK